MNQLQAAAGQALPHMIADGAGQGVKRTSTLIDRLSELESPAFTARRARREESSGAKLDPIVWKEACGSNVVDVDGNRYVDLTSGFGVASVGHAHPRVVAAITQQATRLMHGLGDVHPSDVKISLLETVNALVPWESRSALSVTGSDALATALKTAALRTGRSSVVAFEGGYHGLAYGPLALCGYREAFRKPFERQLNSGVTFLPFPTQENRGGVLAQAYELEPGAVVVEPMLGRGGAHTLPDGFLKELQATCRKSGSLLIVDEVFTGLGRCGSWLMSLEMGASPDLICVGKALGGGMPISACIGTLDAMSAWGDPVGEALHTGTFFGHPVSCAAALAALEVLGDGLVERSQAIGTWFRSELEKSTASIAGVGEVRGRGLAIAIELGSPKLTLSTMARLLEKGYIVLPTGSPPTALQIAPALNIEKPLLSAFIETLVEVLE